jgi:hypothetical protein
MKLVISILVVLLWSCSNTSNQFAKADRKCNFNQEQEEIAWRNVVSYVRSELPSHAKFCALNERPKNLEFLIVEGECRIYLDCSNQVDGEVLLHGDMLVVVDEQSQKAIKAYGIKW